MNMYLPVLLFCRKYFKIRNEYVKDINDTITLDKFQLIQSKDQLQKDGSNCGVLCLKVYVHKHACN